MRRNRPGAIDWPPPSEFDRLLMREGYRVEAIARRMLEEGPEGELFDFQVEFDDGTYLARADAVKRFADGSIEIFEVKSSTSPAEHLVDACFQRIVAERAGLSVSGVHIIHVNPDYRREGDVDASALLIIQSVDEGNRTQTRSVQGDPTGMLPCRAVDGGMRKHVRHVEPASQQASSPPDVIREEGLLSRKDEPSIRIGDECSGGDDLRAEKS
ncbi:hypothetical protein A3726_09210 [Erythrobacter sp. HI0037]|nr:hypothetical protein A3726_09210 [Erythrobacter sp. HI0037]KZY21992.1 hypothetical protein A3727_12330 [Erythrobacter sp. HI0038]